MKNPFIVGKKVYLRSFERSDLQGKYRAWLNDPDVIKFLAVGTYPQTEDGILKYFESNINSDSQVFFAIIDKESDIHIGNARIYNIDRLNQKAHRGIMIGDKSYWNAGYGREVINLISAYAFETLNLRKLTSTTVGNNAGIIKVNEDCGYSREGVLREEFYRNGKYHDVVYWGLLRSEYLPDTEV
jgi:ribosomal-protein-alanine N-acetyltransferase